MNIFKAYISGFKSTGRTWAMTTSIYVVNLILGILVALPFLTTLKQKAGYFRIYTCYNIVRYILTIAVLKGKINVSIDHPLDKLGAGPKEKGAGRESRVPPLAGTESDPAVAGPFPARRDNILVTWV